MRMSYLRIIFLILFCLLHLEYIFALASDRTWTQEVFLDKRDIPYSVFSIKLKTIIQLRENYVLLSIMVIK